MKQLISLSSSYLADSAQDSLPYYVACHPLLVGVEMPTLPYITCARQKSNSFFVDCPTALTYYNCSYQVSSRVSQLKQKVRQQAAILELAAIKESAASNCASESSRKNRCFVTYLTYITEVYQILNTRFFFKQGKELTNATRAGARKQANKSPISTLR